MDALTRPTPRDMLAHPWIVDVMRQEVYMSRWIRQVWGWQKPGRRSEGYVWCYSPLSSLTQFAQYLVATEHRDTFQAFVKPNGLDWFPQRDF